LLMPKQSDMAENLLLAAVLDRKAENVRFRQKELHRLYNVLKQQKDAICQAILQSASSSKSEADFEFFSAMGSIQQSYESLDFNKLVEKEYLIARSENNTGRRVSLGLVTIRAQKHSRFFSIVDPVAAAIASGNCVLLEVL
jgi:acyl-CoA reductase-like NAD-dependent aldehyde dehydrogenase